MLFLIFMGAGIVILILGLILYKTKKIEILAGYDPNKRYDREGLAKFTGMSLIIMGMVALVPNAILLIANISYGELIGTVIFIVDVIALSIYPVIKSSKYELSEEASSKDKSKFNKMIAIGLGIVVIIALIPEILLLVAGHNTETKINISGSEYEIKSGIFSYHNTSNEIKDVYIKSTIPKFHRLSGYSMDNINKGKYDVDGLGHGSLFLSTNRGPYVYIITDDGFVIINDKNTVNTMKIYKDMKRLKSKK